MDNNHNTVKCPYCNFEIDASKEEFGCHSKINVICPNCDKKCKIMKKMVPVYSVSKINYTKCCECEDIFENEDIIATGGKLYCVDCYWRTR